MKMNIKNQINKLANASLGLILALTASAVSAAQTEITYYVPDALGSPIAAMDQAGNVKWRKHYRPFGEEIEQGTEAQDNRIGYTGHVHDSDTALTYMGARYYDPQIGRFLSLDPAGVNSNDPRTFNRYAYANNNPYRFVDPDGRESQDALYEMLGMPNPNAKLRDAAKIVSETSNTIADTTDSIVSDPTNLVPGMAGTKLVGAAILSSKLGKFRVLTNSQAKQIADKLNLRRVKSDIPKSIQKEVGKNPVYYDKNTNRYYSPDKAGHRGDDAWKSFDSSGNRKTGIFENDGSFTELSD